MAQLKKTTEKPINKTITICTINKKSNFFHRFFSSAKNSRFITSAGGGVKESTLFKRCIYDECQ
jgi:hypothetical protein